MKEEENIPPEKSETEKQNIEAVNKTITSHPAVKKTQDLTTNQQASIENMDVHHHPDLHHKKKNFKEYFLESLMIFLAVTLGFIAENIREHISDRKREKGYIIGLIQNLQDDTVQLKRLIKDNSIVNGIDSLMTISKNQFLKTEVQDSIFYYSLRYLYNENDFKQNDFTIIQLRNAGGYRLIEKDHVADSIGVYEAHNTDLKSQASYYLDNFSLRIRSFDAAFDLTAAPRFFKAFASLSKIPTDIPVLTTRDTAKINLYFNQCYELGATYQGYNNMLKGHLEYITRFIAFLKKEYDLE